ncbi:MAG: exosome complex RNA-binding protein Rrp4 [Candidatus Pacearchaeota archaeon]
MENRKIVVPGEKIVVDESLLPGEFVRKEENALISMKYGLAEISEKIVKVIPLSGVYVPKKGDNIIGYVTSINYNGWVIDFDGHFNGFLPISETSRYIEEGFLRDYLDYGESVYARIKDVQMNSILLTTKFKGLGKLSGGQLTYVNPYRIPRIIGKNGSMISLIKNLTRTMILIGQNGNIWIKGERISDELKAKKVIKFIEENCFINGLTEKVEEYFKEIENE